MLPNLVEELKVQLLNTAYCELDNTWNYTDIVSPFTRIYLITAGGGYIYPNNQCYELRPGYLYLIPSYTHCSYSCPGNTLSQYYIHFTNQFTDGLKIFDSVSVHHEIKASTLDSQLFQRLVEINKNAALVQSDPKVYQRQNWASSLSYNGNSITALETNGILRQVLSRFIRNADDVNASFTRFSRLREVFKFIHTHLKYEIRMDQLAEIACYSTDHFTRRFKKTTGLLPVEYINNKRVEMAQLLLLTSTKTQKEISEQAGFSCQQYYSRVFRKKVGCSPVQYRKMHGFV